MYLAAIGVFIGYIVALNYAGQIESPVLAGLVDSLGLVTLEEVTQYWTEAERNSRLVGLPATLAWNRAFWLAVARNALAEVAGSRWLIVALLACVGLPLLWGWNVGDTVFDTSTWSVILLVTEEVLAGRSLLLFFVLILVYAGELVWKVRELGAPLYLQMHRIQSGKQTTRITVPREPARAGIDPYRTLIDRERDDNVREVRMDV